MDNFQVVLKSRPGVVGVPTVENFDVEECPYPEEVNSGEVMVQTLYISVDPAMRCQMNTKSGVHYLQPWRLGECIQGLGGVGIVLSSGSDKYKEGDIVAVAFGFPWKKYFVIEASKLEKVKKEVVGERISLVLSCLGLIGLTALLGLREKGHIKEDNDQTCVISGAAGACGSLAGQIAKLEGCSRVIGICGSDEKCTLLKDDLGYDAALNYKAEDFVDQLKEACPDGVNIYFDNVGGDVSDAVISMMNQDSHVVLCGQISQYNKTIQYPPPLKSEIQKIIETKNICRDRYLVFNYREKFQSSLEQLALWIQQGKIKVLETFEEGIENTPKAFVNMMNGGNIGKQLVHVSDP